MAHVPPEITSPWKRIDYWLSMGSPNTIEFDHRGKKFLVQLHQDYREQMKFYLVGYAGFYESEMLDYIADTYPTHGTILDIGANIGNHAKYFESFLSYNRLYCFEPDAKNCEILRKNVTRAEIKQVALGNKTGRVGLTRLDQYNSGSTCVTDGDEVDMITLDSLDLQNVTLIKLDVEGKDIDVLLGGAQTIGRCKPVIFIERPRIDSELAKLTKVMDDLGYQRRNSFFIDVLFNDEWVYAR